jgi:hypothetical protein
VGIYFSKAGVWTHQSAWDQSIRIHNILDSAFFRGVMYLSFLSLGVACCVVNDQSVGNPKRKV